MLTLTIVVLINAGTDDRANTIKGEKRGSKKKEETRKKKKQRKKMADDVFSFLFVSFL